MPGSFARDPSPTSSSSGRKVRRTRKEKQELTGTGGDAGSKKKDKNARDGGGVVAAVTKHGAKFSHGNGAREPRLPPESPPSSDPSPELKAATPAAIPTNGSGPGPGASPLLDTMSGTSFATSTAPSMAEWTKSHGALGGSPNLISLMGESPPTQPSSYEDQRHLLHNWTTQRAYVNNHAPSASPPTGTKRPLSFQLDAPGNDMRSQASSPSGARRSSMQSPYSQPRIGSHGSHPPLPHQAQAHFYGAPEIDFDLSRKTGLKAGDRGYYLGFDTWPGPNLAYSPGSGNVALAGYEGGLDIYSVSKRGADPLASLKGLRGGVYNAKILPWGGRGNQGGIYPLIAVVVHGPVLPSSPVPDISVEAHYDERTSPRMDGIDTPQSDTNTRPLSTLKSTPVIEAYQTTVEVYSLKTNTLVCTLLSAPRIPVKTSATNPAFRSPPPSGAFQIRADEGKIVVSSGITGECWVFRDFPREAGGMDIRCVAKLWTSLQQARQGDGTPEDDTNNSPVPPRQNPQHPILSINGRWLAYCPPAPSTQIALNAAIGVATEGKVPGLNTLTSPVLPSETSDVDQPISDGVMNRIMRETTQEVIQGARWVGKQGMQLWNNYWKQPGPQVQARQPPVGSPPWGPTYPGRDAPQFPPTYGVSGQAVTKDPGLVSILDLETLESSTSIHPVTTFKAPLGCSFLSLSPTGLSLFTASSKGDVQTVWDLMRIQYSKSSALQNPQPVNGHATRVRQIAQFSRMTVARIVDVAWAKPNGERAAMVTERGTVHLLDMPPSAYAWPPPRRRVKAEEPGTGGAENAPSAVTMASTALSSAYDVARPLINRRRRSVSTTQSTQSTSRIMDHASYGGKVLAAGISHSLGNAGSAINHLRHTGDNRVSLPRMGSGATPGPACVVWLTGRRSHTLFVAGGGLVRSFPSQSRQKVVSVGKDGHGHGQRHVRNRYTDYKLRNVPDDLMAPVVRRLIDPEEELEHHHHQQEFDGGKTLVLNTMRPRPVPVGGVGGGTIGPDSSIPQAEIESSAPYQPFHTDRRVGLWEYGPELDNTTTTTTMTTKPSSLDAVTRILGAAALGDDDDAGGREGRGKARKVKQQLQQQQQQQQQQASSQAAAPASASASAPAKAQAQAWAFGQSIDARKVDVGLPALLEDDFFFGGGGGGSGGGGGHGGSGSGMADDHRALPASAMERVLEVGENDEQIVVTTRRRRGGRGGGGGMGGGGMGGGGMGGAGGIGGGGMGGIGAGAGDADDEDGFFEDDCEVLDFADQRV